ncbi:hypothetical protein [uncultured Devosia sp.]|uniref:hypothetical protein n=1 Tax=uncultured Devosia sp. TaxID=211434 RepID=UPI0026024D6C|nr:hypothetical protein [uncultured Devosia sp.]
MRKSSQWVWLKENWEPITALCALFIAALSLIFTWAGHREIERANRLARAPLVRIVHDVENHLIAIENLGFGPGKIYHLDFAVGDFTWSLDETDQPHLIASEISDAVGAALYETAPELADRLFETQASFTQPLSILKVGDVVPIFRFSSDFFNDAPPDAFRSLYSYLSIRACVVDMLGETGGRALSGANRDFSVPCPEPFAPYQEDPWWRFW